MRIHLLFITIVCLYQANIYAQKSTPGLFKKQSAGTSISIATPANNQGNKAKVLSQQDLDKMAQVRKVYAESELTKGKVVPGRQSLQKDNTPPATPYITRADTKLARASKPGVTIPTKKTTEEHIADIEQEIDRLANSDDPEKALRIQKLEKLLGKKKLEKFSHDLSN